MPAIIRRITGLKHIRSKILHFIRGVTMSRIKKNPPRYMPGSIIEYEDDTVENRWGFDELTILKQLVTQVVLLKTGIFAVPEIFVEKQLKTRTIFAS
jgi:hypothetical protein